MTLPHGAGLLLRYNGPQISEFSANASFQQGYEGFRHQIPMLVFLLSCVALSVVSFQKKLSLLPVLGLLINLYLMTQLGISNWTLFFIWLLIGLGVYFGYGYANSKLNRVAGSQAAA